MPIGIEQLNTADLDALLSTDEELQNLVGVAKETILNRLGQLTDEEIEALGIEKGVSVVDALPTADTKAFDVFILNSLIQHKLVFRNSENTGWVNLLVDKNIEVTDAGDNYTSSTLDGVLAEIAQMFIDKATKVEASSTNGNIKVNGSEVTVYTHPATHSADILVDGVNNKVFTAADKANLDNAVAELAEYNEYLSGVDADGTYTVVEYKRPSNGTLYLRSTLSQKNVTTGYYERMTIEEFNSTGTTVVRTVTYALTYDANGTVIRKEVV